MSKKSKTQKPKTNEQLANEIAEYLQRVMTIGEFEMGGDNPPPPSTMVC